MENMNPDKNNLNIKEESVKISLDSAKRLYMRSELYKLLQNGFWQEIASNMYTSVVNTLDFARTILSKSVV